MTMSPPTTILSDLMPEARATPVSAVGVDVDAAPAASVGPMTPLEADLARVEALRRGLPEGCVVVRLRPGAAVGVGHPWIHLPRDVEVLPEGETATGGQGAAQAAPSGGAAPAGGGGGDDGRGRRRGGR